MPTDQEARLRTARHYDEAYYRGQYGAVMEDELNYTLLSLYWRDALFIRNGLDTKAKVLDFGCGVGQVSAALPDTVCFDVSPVALAELRRRGRVVKERREDIPPESFDYLLSSHSLEHSSSPYQDLEEFHQYLRPDGQIVLVLPVETHLRPALQPDWNQHLQAWTFQTITNMLVSTGWKPMHQSMIYGPYMLRTLGKRWAAERTIRVASLLGRLRRGGASMLTIARIV